MTVGGAQQEVKELHTGRETPRRAIDVTVKVLKRWGKQNKTSMKSRTLKAMLQRLIRLGVLAEPIDCMKPELWPQIEAELAEQAKLGKPEHLMAWARQMR